MLTISTSPSPLGDITLARFTNAGGASVVLSTLGAGIVEVNVPDSTGKLADVVLGYADPADYIADGPCAGKVPGRYANRIAGGHLLSTERNTASPSTTAPTTSTAARRTSPTACGKAAWRPTA